MSEKFHLEHYLCKVEIYKETQMCSFLSNNVPISLLACVLFWLFEPIYITQKLTKFGH